MILRVKDKPLMSDSSQRLVATFLLVSVVISVSTAAHAGLRSSGKYSGVVIFDRWGGCILFSGVYLMHISETVKEQLREYDGQAIEIDALDVIQPVNPGDGLIRRFTVLGSAKATQRPYTVEGITLSASPTTIQPPHAIVTLTITNQNTTIARIHTSQIGFVLLSKRKEGDSFDSPSDGPSTAVITRADVFLARGNWERKVGERLYTYSYAIADEDRLPESFELQPGQSRNTKINFALPAGNYQFFAGYGGGVHEDKLIVSNPVSIDFWE